MEKRIIGEGEARIILDGFENFILKHKNKLQKNGFRLYLWNQWRSKWNMYQVVSRNDNGELETEDMVGTREEFENYLNEFNN